jgi:hypothetical protein
MDMGAASTPLSAKPSHMHYHFRAITWRWTCRGRYSTALPMTCLKHVHESICIAMRMLWYGTKRDVMKKTTNVTFRQEKSCITLQRPFSNPCSQRAIHFLGRAGGGGEVVRKSGMRNPPQPNISHKDT